MSDYLDKYRNRLWKKGTDYTKAITNNNIDFYNRHFHEDESYHVVHRITAPNMESEMIDVRIANKNDTNNKNMMFLFRPRTEITVGDIIQLDEKRYYLIQSIQDNLLSPMALGIKCNKRLKWEGLPNDIIIPVAPTSSSYGAKGEVYNNDQISDFDSRGIMSTQKNKYTDTIYNGMRFVFNHSKEEIYTVTKVQSLFTTDDFNDGNGYIQFISKYTRYVEMDDLENNIAYNPKMEDIKKYNQNIYDSTIEIYGDDAIKVNNTKEFSVISNNNYKFQLDSKAIENNYATIVSQEDNSCVIKGLSSGKLIYLYAMDELDNMVADKLIYIL